MEVDCHIVTCTSAIVSLINKIDTDDDVVTFIATVQPVMTSLKSEGTENGCFTFVLRVVFVLVVRKQWPPFVVLAAYCVPFHKSGLSYPQRVVNNGQKRSKF
jgi:hypothetical protein